MVAAILQRSSPRLALVAGLLLLLGANRVSAAQKTAEQSLFISVHDPITTDEVSRVKSITSAALERFHKAGQKDLLVIVYDFNPGKHASGSNSFGSCLDLADYIVTLNDRTHLTTVAFVHKNVSRHTVLPVLACNDIVMAAGDDVHLGNVFPDAGEQPKKNHVHYYGEIAGKRGRCPALVLKMLDKDMDVLRGTQAEGRVWYVDRRRQKEENLVAVQPEPVLPAGTAGFYSAKQAQEFGLCKQQLNTRQEVAQRYDMPESSLHEDPLDGQLPVAWRIEVRGTLNTVKAEGIRRHIHRMIGQGANFIIVQLACGGGDPVVARSLGDFLRELKDSKGQHPVMTVAYVTGDAHDTAAFLALGCTEIVIDRKAKLGDFEHYLQSRSDAELIALSLESLAQKRDKPPLLARALSDRDLALYEVTARANPDEHRFISDEELQDDRKGEQKWGAAVPVKQRGQYLTLNGETALKLHLAQHEVENLDQLFEKYGLRPDKVNQTSPDWLDSVADFLRQPMSSIVLVMLGIACLILELKIPGVGLPGILSAVCFILFFWAYWHMAFFWLAVLLFVLGLVLIALELFAMPGVVVLGVSGVVLLLAGLGLATMERWPQTEYEWETTALTLGRFGLSLVGAIGVAIVAARYLPNIPYANRLVLVPPADRSHEPSDAAAQVEAARRSGLLGAIGVAATALRPAGMVRFGDEFIDVVSESSYVEPGLRVQVIEIEGNRIVVKEV
jgi:membrane-bound ClpP family serine protease